MPVSLQSNALSTLDEFKRYKGLSGTSDDDKIAQLINAVSDGIERYIGRSINDASYVEWHSSAGGTVNLKNYPVLRISGCRYGSTGGIRIDFVGTAILATVSVNETEVTLYSVTAAGTETTTSLTMASYKTLSTMATAINAVSGWDAALVDDDDRSVFLHPMAEYAAYQNGVATQITLDYASHGVTYSVDSAAGILRIGTAGAAGFWSDECGCHEVQGSCIPSIAVAYTAGYATLPQDIVQITNEMTAELFDSGGINAALNSESFGTYSYSTGVTSVVIRNTDLMAARLARWKREPIGMAC